MKTRLAWFVALAVVLAAIFVRLGFWQLDRLAERRSDNRAKQARLAEPTLSFEQLRRDVQPWLRRAFVDGTPDYDQEFVVTGRSRNGSPGVHIMTPVRMPGNDTAVLVNRGWVYAADAATVDLSRWREERTRYRGHTELLPSPATESAVKGRGIRTLSSRGVDLMLPYPFFATYLVSHDTGTGQTPARLPEPSLGDGPHLSYAIQWFCFAAIALGGAGAVLRSRRKSRPEDSG